MVNTIKFSEFADANLNDSTNETVGLGSGLNVKSPKVVVWTTATRPSPPFDGLLGLNTDLEQYEFWDSTLASWVQLASNVDLLATFITKQPDLSLPNSFALSTLATGILKSTTGSGNLSISAPITSIDNLTTIANEILYTTSSNVYATTSLTTFSRGLLADSTASAWRTDLGVPSIPVSVANGGTGGSSFTPFSIITAGTSPTGAFQNVVGVGTSGQVLTSNGAGLLPSWQAGGGSGSVNPGLVNEVAWYAASGTTISGLVTAVNSVLITDNSGAPSIGSTIPLAVQLNITELGTISTGVWNGSLIPLAFGGTNASLTASNGGVVYSNATQLQILAATATAGQLLQSGSNSAPSWTTATYPAVAGSAGQILRSNGTNWVASAAAFANTYANNTILYANGANNVAGLSPTASAVLVSNSGATPTWSSTMTNGQIIIGSTGSTPIAASLTAGSNITITPGAGSITISAVGGGSGTVNPGTVNQVAWYAATGSAVSGLPTAINGVLITDGAGVPSIGATIPLAVQLNITELGTISTGVWNGSIVSLAFGGTNANLTASNGGIVYSNATQLQILSGTSTAGQLLQSGANTAPSWTTATFPTTAGSAGQILRSNGTNWVASAAAFADTYANNTILYANGANNVEGLTASASSVLVSTSASTPVWSSTLTNGQVIIGSTGSTPVAATLTGGTGVTVSNTAGGITISATASGLTWSTIAGTSQAANVDSGFVSGNAAQTTITLPATAPLGSVVEVQGLGAAGWILKANTSQTIKIGITTTSSAGTLTSVAASDNVSVVCVVANTTWRVQWTNSQGLTVA